MVHCVVLQTQIIIVLEGLLKICKYHSLQDVYYKAMEVIISVFKIFQVFFRKNVQL